MHIREPIFLTIIREREKLSTVVDLQVFPFYIHVRGAE
jgi:hypothetical protein